MRQLKFSSILFFIAFFITNAQAQKQAPGTDIIGYGYNVFDEYANQTSKEKYCLFKYNNREEKYIAGETYKVPENVILENISEHIVKTVSGESMREYAKSLSAKVGLSVDAFLFSGSVESSFSSSSSGMKKSFYYTYMDANTKWRISLDIRGNNIDPLKPMLEPRFAKDLENMEPETLFETYGTHYIASAYLGGRVDYKTKTVMTSNTSTKEIATAVEAKYRAVSANTSVSQKHKQTLSKSKTKEHLTVVGGNSEYLRNINDLVAYDDWASGIKDAPVLCDFEEGSLRPIWEFASPDRQKELKAEFRRMVKANPLPEPMAASMLVSNRVFFIKNVGDGMYMDIPGYHFNAKINAPVNVYPKDNVKGHGGRQGIDRFIKLIPHDTDPNYVFLRPQHSDRVFDVVNASKAPGTGIGLWHHGKNNAAQMFKLIEVDGKDNTYYIENKNSGLVLTSNGRSNQITQEKNTKSEKQQWYLESAGAEDMAPMKTLQSYALRNVEANRYVDIGGYGAKAGTKNERVQLWDKGTNPDRYISLANTNLDDWYYVRHNHSSEHYWDIESGNNANGTKLQLWTKNEKPQQHFKFIYAGSAMTFYIQNRDSKKYIDASRSRLGKNGCPIQIWSKNGNDNQKWKLEPAGPVWFVPEKPIKVKVKSAFSNKTWDLAGGSSEMARKKGSQLQIWHEENADDHYYTITPSGDGSYIHLTTWMVNGQEKMRIGVDGNPSETDHKVITWTPHNGAPQKFRIHPTGRNTCVIYTTGWKTLDIEGWKYNEAGADIQTYHPHWKYNQQFQLIDAGTGKPIDFRKYIK